MAIKKVMINKVLNKWGTTVMDLKIIPTILILIVLIASILIIPAESVSAADSSESKFKDTNVLNQPGGSLAGGIELGDPDDDGIDEVIVVGGSGEAGRVTVIDYNSSKGVLETPTIWVDSQALVDVVSADIDPFSDGEEIIVGGYSRNVTVLYWPGGLESASIKSIDSLPEQIFGLTAGELNDSHAGLELAVVDGKTTNLTIYQSGSAKDNWDKIVIPFNKTLRNVEAGDYDPAHAGDELILLASDGTVYSVIHNSGSWDVETVWQDVDSLLDAAIGDADPDTDGNEIVVVGLSWRATMLHKSASGVWNITELWKAPGGLEGIDIGEFDPSHAGFEIAMGGYSRTVVMMYREDDTWRNNVIYEDKESSQSELNGVVIGEFNPAHKDNEVMVVGASGVTTMLEYIYPDFTLSTVSETKQFFRNGRALG